jgi:hypothetical protein
LLRVRIGNDPNSKYIGILRVRDAEPASLVLHGRLGLFALLGDHRETSETWAGGEDGSSSEVVKADVD